MSDDEFEQRNALFLQWLASRGVAVSKSIKIADYRSEGRGRGVVAVKDIAEDETIFTVPRSAVLLPSGSAIDEKLLEQLTDSEGQVDPWLGLVLAMCYETLLGPASAWKPYLDVLPMTFDTPIFWSSEELNELQASSLQSKIGKASADEQFTTRVVPLLRQLPHSKHLNLDREGLSLCHRMASTIMAYAFDIEPPQSTQKPDEDGYVSDAEFESLPKGMVPLADLLNADGTRNNARLFYEDDALIMKSITRIQAGEELFNDYGELPRSDLLRRYGYVTPEYAKWDVVELSLHELILPIVKRRPSAKHGEMQKRLAFLEEHDVLEASYDAVRADDTLPQNGYDRLLSQLPGELLVLLRTLLLPAKGFEGYLQRGKLPKIANAVANEPPVPEAVVKILLEIIMSRIAGYSTTLAADLDLRGGPPFAGNRRKAMALEVRIGEKEILADVEASLRQILGSSAAEDLATEEAGSDSDRKSKRQRLE